MRYHHFLFLLLLQLIHHILLRLINTKSFQLLQVHTMLEDVLVYDLENHNVFSNLSCRTNLLNYLMMKLHVHILAILLLMSVLCYMNPRLVIIELILKYVDEEQLNLVNQTSKEKLINLIQNQ